MSDSDPWHDQTVPAADLGLTEPGKRPAGERPYIIVLSGSNVGQMFCVHDSLVIGRDHEVEVCLQGESISRRHARLQVRGEGVVVEDLGSTNGTFVNGKRVSEVVLKDGDKVQIGPTTILKFTYSDELEERFQRALYNAALRDGLTQIFNKRYFLHRLVIEYQYSLRHGTALALLLFDLDHFKKINDRHGHPAGDRALQHVAMTVGKLLRSEDVFARYGGEEFAILSRGQKEVDGMALAERLRIAIERSTVVIDDDEFSVTASFGVAELPHAELEGYEELLGAADKALYEAKERGRNRTVSWKPADD